MTIEIRLLAGFEVRRDGAPVLDWPRAAPKRLLKLLAIAPQHAVSVQQLCQSFWPTDLGDRVRQRLHHLVFLLNDVLGPLSTPGQPQRRVQLRDGMVRLCSVPHTGAAPAAANVWIDVDHFKTQLAQALATTTTDQAQRLQDALALYTGTLLPGDTTDAAFGPPREQLQLAALAGWHALADAHLQAGAAQPALHALNQAVALAPSDEAGHCKLMRLHASLGQRGMVERQYSACKAALALALGVQPSAHTHQTYRDAMLKEGLEVSPGPSGAAAGLESGSDTPGRWLPPQPQVALIDRHKLLQHIQQTLARAGHRLVTLVGAGGMGKTQLSLRVAHDLAHQLAPGGRQPHTHAWRDGVCWVSLADVGPDGVWDCIRRALHGADPASRDIPDLIIQRLRDKHLLLVLDNCEHVVQSLGVLSRLLQQAPGVKVLATSRRPLNLMGERIVQVPPLKATLNSAVKLFTARARAMHPGFKLDAGTRADVLAITQRLEGVPLSIELVAARAHAYAPSALRRALEDGFADTVAGGGADRPERHQSLQQSLAWSYQLLLPQDQIVLHHAALFRAPFELAALRNLCGADTPHFADTAQALQELGFLAAAVVDAPAALPGLPGLPGIVSRLHVPAGTLEFLRSLDTPAAPSTPTGRGLFAHWFVQRVEALDAQWAGPPALQTQARAALDADHDNHFAALEYAAALADPHESALVLARLTLGLSRYWRHCGAWARADAWVDRACLLAHLLAPAMQVNLLIGAASYWFESQRFERAHDLAQRAISATTVEAAHAADASHPARPAAAQDLALHSRATLLFAAATYHLGQSQLAIPPLLTTSALALAAGRQDIHTVAQNNLGNCYLTAGQLKLAQRTFAACEAAHDGAPAQTRTAAVLNLAVVAHYQGRRPDAQGLVTHALAMEHSSLPRPARLAQVWARTSWMWCCHGDAAEGERALQQARSVADQAQLRVWQHICTAQHGKLLLVAGQTQAAQAVLARSVQDCLHVTDPWDVLDTSLWLLWSQLQLAGGLPAARATLGQIISRYGLSWRHEHPRVLEAAAACLVAGQDFAHAAIAWRQARQLRHTQGSVRFVYEQAHARRTLAALRAALGRDWQSTEVATAASKNSSKRAATVAPGAADGLDWLHPHLS
jgi:predicted ATPase/DNA-binding SARP family transcriptional activator/tetratricopeptide (TPR) repeat protein